MAQPDPTPSPNGLPAGWSALVDRLKRSHPDPDEAGALAQELELEPEFVEDVIRGSVAPPARGDVWKDLARLGQGALAEVWKGIARFFQQGLENPAVFIAVTVVILAAGFHVAFAQSGAYTPGVSNLSIGIRGVPSVLISGILGLQLLAFARWGSYKKPIWAAVGLNILLAPAVWLITRAVGPRGEAIAPQIALGILVAIMSYLGLCLGAALLGNWVKLRREARLERRLTRQELLARLFTVNDQLARLTAGGKVATRRRSFKEWARTSGVFPLWGVLYGLGFGLVEVLVVGGVSAALVEGSLGRAELISILQGFFNILAFGLFGLLGYYAGGMWRGVVAAVVASGGRLLATLFPIGIYGLGFVREESRREIFYVLMLMAVILGLLGGAAGQIDRRTARSRRLGAKDPAALLSEVVRLERRLRAGQTGACVMAVDVARSTMIKEGADSLAVEFSFREYQEMVARVAQENGGEVFATAGDGTLASFLDPANALRAARQVQTDIHAFNDQVNRLAHPFRVRIGLHAGETQAEFSEAPFNELIDVAAHVESASPIGGIAATEAFRRLLPEEDMAEVARSVDGHSVWIVLTPFLSED